MGVLTYNSVYNGLELQFVWPFFLGVISCNSIYNGNWARFVGESSSRFGCLNWDGVQNEHWSCPLLPLIINSHYLSIRGNISWTLWTILISKGSMFKRNLLFCWRWLDHCGTFLHISSSIPLRCANQVVAQNYRKLVFPPENTHF